MVVVVVVVVVHGFQCAAAAATPPSNWRPARGNSRKAAIEGNGKEKGESNERSPKIANFFEWWV